MDTKSIENNARISFKVWISLALIILLVVFVRTRLLEIPLERDEGEYAYMGQLLLQGIPPYSEAYNMKFPGTYLMYALIMALFGQTIQGIHLGFMILNCATVVLIYFLGRRIVDDFEAVIASSSYAVLSISSSVLGFAAHATHFVVLPAVAGALLLLNAIEKNRLHIYLLSGIMFSLAFLMKQPGIFFFLFGVSYILYHHFSLKSANSLKGTVLNLSVFMSGSIMPLIPIIIWFHSVGVFDKFWFWTFQYASKYGTQIPVSRALGVFKNNLFSVIDGFFILWFFSLFGLIFMLFHRKLKVKKAFVVLFSIFSFLSITPGFYFRPHYFVMFLPAVAILIGIFINYFCTKGVSRLTSLQLRSIFSAIIIVAALVGIVDQKDYFFKDDPVRISRKNYGANPFPESLEISKFIESRTSKSDRIAVIGSEPQIYFYSNRRSATGHIYTYGLMEHHDYSLFMQKEMIKEIESSDPRFLVFVNIFTSWLIKPDSERFIFEWLEKYISRGYSLVGVADIISPDETVYKWYEDANNYIIQGESHVLVFERR